MEKKYEKFGTVTIKLLPRKDREDILLMKDVKSGLIMGSKHINYFNAIGMDTFTRYECEYARYTNSNGYPEFDLMEVCIVETLTNKVNAKPKTPKAESDAKPKPSWLR